MLGASCDRGSTQNNSDENREREGGGVSEREREREGEAVGVRVSRHTGAGGVIFRKGTHLSRARTSIGHAPQ